MLSEQINWKAKWKIGRYANEQDFNDRRTYPEQEALSHFGRQQFSEVEGNLLLNAGIQLMLDLLIGEAGTVYSNANAYIGVGDSSTAAAATQTGLQAASNKLWMPMEDNYPARSSQTLTFRAVFGSSDGNFAWEEFTIVNDEDDDGVNLNRKVSSQGTKQSGQVWTVDVTLTIS